MKERPILFSAPMVRATLQRLKTQSRRIIKPQPVQLPGGGLSTGRRKKQFGCPIGQTHSYGDISAQRFLRWLASSELNPYGLPGDRLWGRENWGIYDGEGMAYDYPNGIPRECPAGFHVSYPADDRSGIIGDVFKWRPSIHMPRWASRILLEIASSRVERLNDISEADAWAEGIGDPEKPLQALVNVRSAFPRFDLAGFVASSPKLFVVEKDRKAPDFGKVVWTNGRGVYAALWEAINGPGSWNANPYVWVEEFKLLEGGLAA